MKRVNSYSSPASIRRSAAILWCIGAMACQWGYCAESESVYRSYADFQWSPGMTGSADATKEMRKICDFTVPLHGQYLTNPGYDSMTISWITRVPCAGGVAIREKGGTQYRKIWKKKYGQIDFSSDTHSIHLEGLKPGTEYEYRLLSASDRFFGYDLQEHIGRESFLFRTLDPARDRYKVLLTADFHGGGRFALEPMLKGCGADDADFVFFLGDNVDNSMDHARFYMFHGFLDDISRLYGKRKPSVILRGNHDIYGREQAEWGTYLPRKDGKTYFAFAQGPVLFVCLDTMWNGGGSPVQTAAYEEYRREQAQWLRELKASAMWKDARFRIVAAHIGTHGTEGADFVSRAFKEVLNDTTSEGRIHLYLCGHEHVYMRINPRNDRTMGARLNPKYPRIPPDFNYPLVCGRWKEGLVMEVFPDKLVFASHIWNLPRGGVVDSFEITPDGTIRNLMPVKEFAPPEQPERGK